MAIDKDSRSSPGVAVLPDRFLSIKQVVDLVGASRSSVYSWIKLGRFPAPKRIGVRRTGWLASELARWVHDREET